MPKVLASLFTLAVVGVAYATFGFWTMLVIASGFLIGLILWFIFPTQPPYEVFRAPYWVCLGLFVLHRIEERFSGFFETLAGITRLDTPDILSLPVILLVVLSVGAWLLIPVLASRRIWFGHYLAWTFFASLGITELAHIVVFPFFTAEPIAYFPGMASVFVLAPAAWWGMWRLSQKTP